MLEGFTYVDFACNLDHRLSTIGYLFTFARELFPASLNCRSLQHCLQPKQNT